MKVFINTQKSKEDQILDDKFCQAVEAAIERQMALLKRRFKCTH